jgi:threonine aldolase
MPRSTMERIPESPAFDLRSDTVTKPTPGMLEAMMRAEVGDDVLGEDPTVRRLEQELAARFGMEAGLFCPSGTMANQIAIRTHTAPQDQVICDQRSHIYLYEGGGVAANSLVTCRLVEGDLGRISAEQVLANINPDDIHYPTTRLVSLENTMNKGGGSCYEESRLADIREVCLRHGLRTHLDGARVFNALVATGQSSQSYAQYFDSISVCLSKGLGTPVGSVLLGRADFIRKANRVRKMMGGGMRQAGYLAAAGLYALEHHLGRLADDHRRASAIARALEGRPYVAGVLPCPTNIVIFEVAQGYSNAGLLRQWAEQGLLAAPFGPSHIRLVTHLGIGDAQLEGVLRILAQNVA